MIVRIWRGRTSLRATAYPDYGEVSGNRGWMLLRHPLGATMEFMLVSFWDSMDAVMRYAGGGPSIKVPVLYMPSATNLYFPLTDAR